MCRSSDGRGGPRAGDQPRPLRGGDEVRAPLRVRQRHPQVRDVRADAAAEPGLRDQLQVRSSHYSYIVLVFVVYILKSNILLRIRIVRAVNIKSIKIGSLTNTNMSSGSQQVARRQAELVHRAATSPPSRRREAMTTSTARRPARPGEQHGVATANTSYIFTGNTGDIRTSLYIYCQHSGPTLV